MFAEKALYLTKNNVENPLQLLDLQRIGETEKKKQKLCTLRKISHSETVNSYA